MYSILKYTHFTFILVAIIMFIVRFYWLKSGSVNSQKQVYKKIHIHSNLAIVVIGVGLMILLQFNPFIESGYWLLEKIIAFVVYFFMVQTALNEDKKSPIQWLAFIGVFGWLAFIGKLAVTKQALFLVG